MHRTGDQEIGDVGAGDEQHNGAHRREPNRELHVGADRGPERLVDRSERDRRGGIAALDKSATIDGSTFGGRRCSIDSGPKSGDDPRQPERTGSERVRPVDLRCCGAERQPHVR